MLPFFTGRFPPFAARSVAEAPAKGPEKFILSDFRVYFILIIQ